MAAILKWEDLHTCMLIYWLGLPKRARAGILKEVTSVEGEGGAFEHKNAKKYQKNAKTQNLAQKSIPKFNFFHFGSVRSFYK